MGFHSRTKGKIGSESADGKWKEVPGVCARTQRFVVAHIDNLSAHTKFYNRNEQDYT